MAFAVLAPVKRMATGHSRKSSNPQSGGSAAGADVERRSDGEAVGNPLRKKISTVL